MHFARDDGADGANGEEVVLKSMASNSWMAGAHP
jgi:hypothetical protein